MRFLLLLLATTALQAELLRIEMDFGGMDCASCSDFIKNRFTKNPSVYSVDIDNKKGTVIIVLHPGNKVKFPMIRDQVQQSGYKINETRLVVMGQAMMDVGRTKLKLAENDILLLKDPGAMLREMITRKVLISGKLERVQSDNGMVDILVVNGATHAQ